MAINFKSIGKWLSTPVQLRASPASLSDPPKWLVDWFNGSGGESSTGINVNEEKALTVTTVFRCVNLISSTIAAMPLHVYERMEPRGKQRASGHSLYSLLHSEPNPEMTSYQWRLTMNLWIELFGNGYSEIERNEAGIPIALWPIPPDKVQQFRTDTKALYYEVTPEGGGERRYIRAEDMLHIHGMGNGIQGFKPIQYAREAIGLALATEHYGGKFFANGAAASGIVEHEAKLSDEAFKRFKESFNAAYAGLSNSHRILFLEQGNKFHQVTVPNDNAQFTESRRFQIEEIARFFGVPPHKVGALEKATFSNIEHQAIEYVQDCILPRITNWEQELHRRLFGRKDKNKYFAEFVVSGLLRGDITARGEFYNQMRQNGIMSANDIRELENWNPVPAEDGGDLLLVNGNMVPVNLAGMNTEGGDANAD